MMKTIGKATPLGSKLVILTLEEALVCWESKTGVFVWGTELRAGLDRKQMSGEDPIRVIKDAYAKGHAFMDLVEAGG
jgi:hypothetical protein